MIWFAILIPKADGGGMTLPVYLDPQRRYRPLKRPVLNDWGDIEVQVSDQTPAESPYYRSIAGESLRSIPDLAEPYIHPYCATNSALPRLHDAWENEQYAIVLLEDRSSLLPLIEGWQVKQSSKRQEVALQQLHWMYQMTDLWILLTELAGRPSLMQLDNLLLDDDDLLCLQRLHLETVDHEVSLKQLGETWSQLFRFSEMSPHLDIAQLIQRLQQGQIASPERLRSHLDQLLDSLQPQLVNEDEDDDDPTGWNFAEEDLTVTAPIIPTIQLTHAGQTDIGRQRRHNEDTFLLWLRQHQRETPNSRTESARGLYILCDGMGGHEGGDVASAIAIETVADRILPYWDEAFPEQWRINEAIAAANTAIYQLNQDQGRRGNRRMGTTLVMLLLDGNQAAIAHVGDSRLYRLTVSGGLELLTRDHELGQQSIAQGVDPALAYQTPQAYQLTQALGPRESVRPDIRFLPVLENTLFLLASDGLTDRSLVELHWKTHLKPYLAVSSNLNFAPQELIDLANQENGRDNITAVLVRAELKSL
ncbi:serine/threonine phosphatase [Sodalinema gerasimenkoae]|uniref:serine/threonine phosphatase n=1 Tax=Sodalinema gerasimenkoae TaxID=2862348 RepID=UPI00135AAD56|nr:serine/threonine phosphatase [Sodalinema gerasimenkoae]